MWCFLIHLNTSAPQYKLLGMRVLLPLAVFTADDEQVFTVTLDLPVQACRNGSLSLANVAWYVLHTVQSRSSASTVPRSQLE